MKTRFVIVLVIMIIANTSCQMRFYNPCPTYSRTTKVHPTKAMKAQLYYRQPKR